MTQESQEPGQEDNPIDLVSPVGSPKDLAEAEFSDAKAEEDFNKPMSVLVGQGSQLRKVISAAISRVKANQPVTLKAFGRNQHRAVTLASIVRDRVGDLHQLNSFVEEKNVKDGKERVFVGIQIILSASELDTEDPGYQKPIPRGTVTADMPKRKPPTAENTRRKEVKGKDIAKNGKPKQADQRAKSSQAASRPDASDENAKVKKQRRRRNGRPDVKEDNRKDSKEAPAKV